MLDPTLLVGANTTPPTHVPLDPAATTGGTSGPRHDPRGDSRWALRATAAAIELMMDLDSAAGVRQAAHRIANRLATHLSAQRVFVLWRSDNRHPLAVLVDTAADHNQQRPQSLHRLVIAAAQETVVRGCVAHWPPGSEGDRHALLAVQQLADNLCCSVIDSVGLQTPPHDSCGVILVIGAADPQAGKFLQMLAPPLSSRLAWIDRQTPNKLERMIRGIVQLLRSQRRGVLLAAVGLALCVLLLPLRYKVSADLELQPVKHRYVAAPFDGPLQSARVRPGDVVRQGDLLASINPREIEYELAGIRAELHQAVQQTKGKMAQHDSAGRQIAQLESDRLRLKSELLQYRRANLQIRSPITGVVVSGDWKHSEGMPLSRGETLFEIAPLGKMVVELSIDEDDFAAVRPGMPVDFQVHALPTRSMTGKVDRIHPRAELRQHDNVFIAEVLIDDPDNVLRPGMRGRASIASDRHTLAWNLFHKPYYAVRRAVGW